MINEVVTRGAAPEFDCMYLDMNGIIHQCTHPESLDLLTTRLTEAQMFARIFEYIDRLVHLIKPKHLLFMAVDGVAPRAKMNQQRQRRFKSAKDRQEEMKMAKDTGRTIAEGEPFDSNCITPGTEFMQKVCHHLRFFVRRKIHTDSSWRRMRVILSGPDVPGEGEHKIMLYIRRQKMKSAYPGNLRHCLYGLDADLIMLGLVSHEPHFALLREKVTFGVQKRKSKKSLKQEESFQLLHLSLLRQYLSLEYRGVLVADNLKSSSESERKKQDEKSTEIKTKDKMVREDGSIAPQAVNEDKKQDEKPSEIETKANMSKMEDPIEVQTAREDKKQDEKSLEMETKESKLLTTAESTGLQMLNQDKKQDKKEPEVESKENVLVDEETIGPQTLNDDKKNDGEAPEIKMEKNVSIAKESLGSHDHPERKYARSQERKQINLERLIDDFVFVCMFVGNDFLPNIPMLDIAENGLDMLLEAYRTEILPKFGYLTNAGQIIPDAARAMFSALARIEKPILKQRFSDEKWLRHKMSGAHKGGTKNLRRLNAHKSQREKTDEKNKQAEAKFIKEVIAIQQNADKAGGKLTLDTLRYYIKKFPEFFQESSAGKIRDTSESLEEISTLCRYYWEGLNWVLLYYYQGCAAWGWYFPYHYSPMSLELSNMPLHLLKLPKFELGKPYRPLQQLLSVLPPASKKFLPKPYQELVEDGSPLKDWYPEKFNLDQNFKRAPWEAIALIPFLDEKRLISTLLDRKCDDKLTTAEKRRNEAEGQNYVYMMMNLRKKSDNPRPRVKSTLPGLFGDIESCVAEERLFSFPRKSQDFKPELCKDCRIPAPGFPSLLSLELKPRLANIGLNIFGFKSHKATLTVNIGMTNDQKDVKALVKRFLHEKKHAYINWPCIKEAVVAQIYDGNHMFRDKKSWAVSESIRKDMLKIEEKVERKYISTRGVYFERTRILLEVHEFLRLERDIDGSRRKLFARNTTWVPAPLVLMKHPAPDRRHTEIKAIPFEKEFPLKCSVALTTPGLCFGLRAQIVKYNQERGTGEKGTLKVTSASVHSIKNPFLELSIRVFKKEVAVLYETSRKEEKYIRERNLSGSLNIPHRVLGLIVDSVQFNPKFRDLGLGLRSQRRREMVVGYSRWNGGWEYSTKATRIIRDFVKTFPALVDLLSNTFSTVYNAEDLCDHDNATREQGIEAMDEIIQWQKDRKIRQLKSCPSTSEVFPANIVRKLWNLPKEIQNRMNKEKKDKKENMFMLIKSVKRSGLYRWNPNPPWSPTTNFRCGDRVMSLRSDEGIPCSALGTVIAVHRVTAPNARSPILCDVLLDIPQPSAGTLSGRCPESRGISLSGSSLLNLTFQTKSKHRYNNPVIGHGTSRGKGKQMRKNSRNIFGEKSK